MKISCTQENLSRGLNIVSGITGKNSTLPILNNVLLKTEDGLIKISPTNLEIGVTCNVRGKVESKGEFTVDARVLADYINLLPVERVELELKDNELGIEAKDSSTKVKGLSADDFPLIPQVEKKDPYICAVEDLKQALGQTVFAISVDEARPEINGALFKFTGDTLTIAATDSYRLAEKQVKLKKANKKEQQIIVPLKTLQELNKVLADYEQEDLEIYATDNQVLFAFNEVEMVSRLVEGNFPDYEQIIPKENKTKVKVETEDLVKAVKRVSVFCRSGINDLKLVFIPEKKEIVLSVVNQLLGENTANLSADIQGEEVEITFNFRYLLDGLVNLGSEEVDLGLSSGESPGLIKPVGTAGYQYVVMPIRS